MTKVPNVAVLLAGCGHLDGAEVREAVLTLLALDQRGANYQCLAPNASQAQVIDHATGKDVSGATRNILSEASRISRMGKCQDVAQADSDFFDALLIPGGYGVAKNHCDFAFKGTEAQVRPEVAAFIMGFFDAHKPVGAICISPALIALCLSKTKHRARMTLGNGAEIQSTMERLGQDYQAVPGASEIIIDEPLKLVTTPAYMFDDARLSEVWIGIDRCVAEVLRRI